MDSEIKTECFDSSSNNLAPLPLNLIKIEKEDHPELVSENDLSINYTKTELIIENNLPRPSSVKSAIKEDHHCAQCGEQFPSLKYLQVHEAIHDSKLHCPACDRVFKSEKHFALHIEAHLRNPLKCQHCPEIFLDKRSFNLHMYSHKKIKTYSCSYCLKEWSNKKDLTVHIRVHTNERPFTCAICSKSFKQKGGLTTHIATLHLGDKKKVAKEKFDCDICNGSYSSVSSLNKHVRKIHETGKTFPCKKCGETFLNFQQMKQHKMKVHPELIYNRVCPLCSQKFSCRETFIKHQHMHMETGQEVDRSCFATPIDCYLCGVQIHGMKAFSKHQQLHLLMTDDEIEKCLEAKKFNCKVCGKLFNFKKNLFRHMDVHLEKIFECRTHCSEKFTYLGIRLHMEWYFEQFHCSECNETFIGKKNLKKHYKVHPTMVKFTCKICGHKFRYRRLLITHWKMQHNLKCHVCLKKFITHLSLKKHIRLKHKVKCEKVAPIKRMLFESATTVSSMEKYGCKICKRSLATKQLLKDHMKLHKKKCFQCENCKKNFLYFRNLMFHIKQNICLKYFDNKTGTNSFSCILCKKECNSVESLMTHMRRHCTMLKCKFCNSKFKQKDLHEHISRAHPAEAKFSCDKCSVRFCSLTDLVKHRKYFHRWVVVKSEVDESVIDRSEYLNKEIKVEEGKDVNLETGHSVWIKQESTNL